MKKKKIVNNRIDETLLDGTLKSMVHAMRSANNIGVIDDKLYKTLTDTFVRAVKASLKMEMHKLPEDKRDEFEKFANGLVKYVKKANDLDSFLSALSSVSIAKQNIVRRLSESRFSRFFDGLVKSKDKAMEWIADNKQKFIKMIKEFLTEWITEILISTSSKLQKKGA